MEKDLNGNHITDYTLLKSYEYLTLFTNILQMVLIAIFWVRQDKLKVDLDLNNKTDADFAVIVSNLPNDILTSELRKKIIDNTGIKNDDIVYTNK